MAEIDTPDKTETRAPGYAGSYYYAPPPVWEESVFHYYLNMLRRRIWIVMALFVISSVIGLVHAFRAAVVYRATAKVLVERQAPRVMGFDGVSPDFSMWDPDFFTTQADLVKTWDVLNLALQYPALRRFFPTNSTPKEAESFMGETKRTIAALIGAVPAPPPEPWQKLRSQARSRHLKDTHFLEISSEGYTK